MECKAALDRGRRRHGQGDRVAPQPERKDVGVKRAGHETAEGRIGVFIDPAAKVAAIVELRCESAPVAKNDQFITLANDLAQAGRRRTTRRRVDALLAQPFVGDQADGQRPHQRRGRR